MLVFVRRLLVCVAATTVAFGASSWQASALDETRPSCTGLEPGAARTVTRIIDGETAALDDGTELRLIGALAPRAIDADTEPGMWPAEIAAKEELRALLLGKSVELSTAGLIEVLDEPSSATRPSGPGADRQVPDQPRGETKPPGLVETGR